MNKKYLYTLLLIISVSLIFWGCEKKWDDYYNTYPDSVNKNLWDELKNDERVSKFVELLSENHYDTLFNSEISYSLFVPNNEVLENFLQEDSISDYFLGYHISSHFIQSGNLSTGVRLVKTLSEKYVQLQRNNSNVTIDGVKVEFESPLYLDGKYFILEDVIKPLPNFYEYFKTSNSVLSDYIDSQDSIILDKELSVPIGFDDEGNTIYDTVSDILNKFEEEFFPVKHENRQLVGTIVFPKAEDYNQALNEVANKLGDAIVDYKDIPIEWQQEILLPYLFRKGIFLDKLEPEAFEWRTEKDTGKLLNILGDSVTIDYVPTEQTLCSNGYAYNYQEFTIPEKLYKGSTRFEVERLLEKTGVNKYAWNEFVQVQSGISVLPKKLYINTASNDTVLRVDFPDNYEGNYSVQFKGPRLFPRRYVMVVGTHMDYGGIYDIYINNELARTFSYNEYLANRGVIYSVTGSRLIPSGRYNKFDMYVENITSYDKVDVRFEYKGPGSVANNGLVIDYIEFIPAE